MNFKGRGRGHSQLSRGVANRRFQPYPKSKQQSKQQSDQSQLTEFRPYQMGPAVRNTIRDKVGQWPHVFGVCEKRHYRFSDINSNHTEMTRVGKELAAKILINPFPAMLYCPYSEKVVNLCTELRPGVNVVESKNCTFQTAWLSIWAVHICEQHTEHTRIPIPCPWCCFQTDTVGDLIKHYTLDAQPNAKHDPGYHRNRPIEEVVAINTAIRGLGAYFRLSELNKLTAIFRAADFKFSDNILPTLSQDDNETRTLRKAWYFMGIKHDRPTTPAPTVSETLVDCQFPFSIPTPKDGRKKDSMSLLSWVLPDTEHPKKVSIPVRKLPKRKTITGGLVTTYTAAINSKGISSNPQPLLKYLVEQLNQATSYISVFTDDKGDISRISVDYDCLHESHYQKSVAGTSTTSTPSTAGSATTNQVTEDLSKLTTKEEEVILIMNQSGNDEPSSGNESSLLDSNSGNEEEQVKKTE